ncbi:hypothetical protein [Nonomuraea sp. 10N515B]|uniref:hypothetical protein n=1 Tax=Nonomuraea sp. 10N515B TaxID=3457422 RepID=UPI003FCDC212
MVITLRSGAQLRLPIVKYHLVKSRHGRRLKRVLVDTPDNTHPVAYIDVRQVALIHIEPDTGTPERDARQPAKEPE